MNPTQNTPDNNTGSAGDSIDLMFAQYDCKDITVIEAMDRAEAYAAQSVRRELLAVREEGGKQHLMADPWSYVPLEVIDAHIAGLEGSK